MPRADPTWTPPLREGVAASRVGVGDGRFASVLDFLVARFPAVDNWPARLARGDVLGADGQPLRADAACLPGTMIWYWRDPPPERRVPFDIELLYQDERLVVVDKPHFLPTMPSGRHLHETVLVRLKRQLGIATLAPMHRLDRDTAGVLVFMVQPATRDAYQSLLRDRRVHKVYEAVAPWRPELALPFVCRHRLAKRVGAGFMQVEVVPGEPNAETHVALIDIVEPSKRASTASSPGVLGHYRLMPITGRTHQLRAQLSALGLPIVGDRIYPRLLPEEPADAEPDYTQPLQLLAREFAFRDPFSGEALCFRSRRTLQRAACSPSAD